MDPRTGFVVSLVVTLVFLGSVVLNGFRARRRAHVTSVVLAVLSLLVTIYFAEQLGAMYDVKGTGWIYDTHMVLVYIATPAFLLPIATGLWTTKHPGARRVHRAMAILVLGLTVVAAATGALMMYSAERIPV